MAKKKVEISLQDEVNSQEEWDAILQREGLLAVVRGVNPPELERSILEKLKLEHEVMNGEAERVQLEENGFEVLERIEHTLNLEEAGTLYEELKDEDFYSDLIEFITSGPCTILVCTKGAEGSVEELHNLVGPQMEGESTPEESSIRNKYGTDRIKNAIHVSANKERASCEVALFFPEFKSPIVKVRRIRYVSDTPEDVTTTDNVNDYGQALRCAYTTPDLQRTVALLRPKAHECYKEEILEKIKEAGFVIALEKEMTLSEEKAKEFYKDHQNEEYFGELTANMSSGPILALILAKKDAVETWRNMLGPTDVEQARSSAPSSLRAQFADVVVEEEGTESGEAVLRTKLNLLHGSASLDEAKRDIEFFFPVQRTVAMIKPDAYANRDEIIERIKGYGFHIAATKDIELTKELACQLYVDLKDKPFYEDLVTHMTSGNTLFMVLTRQDAVFGWRKLMGHSDPDKAADECPNNIRATYGRNVLQNAVHGSSSEEHATRVIELIFEDPKIGLPGMTMDFGMAADSKNEGQETEASQTKVSSEVEPSKPLNGEDIAPPEVEGSKPLDEEPQNVENSKPLDDGEKDQEAPDADATANDVAVSESMPHDEVPSEVVAERSLEEENVPVAEETIDAPAEDAANPMENQNASGTRKKPVKMAKSGRKPIRP